MRGRGMFGIAALALLAAGSVSQTTERTAGTSASNAKAMATEQAPGKRVAVADQQQAVRRHTDWHWGRSNRSAGNPPQNRAWKHGRQAERTHRRKAKAKGRRRRMKRAG